MTASVLALGPDDQAPVPASVDALPGLLGAAGTVVWIDIIDPNEDDRKLLVDVFRLHPTSVEDLLADAPTPKFERFDGYLYVVWHALVPGWEDTPDFQLCDLDVLIGDRFLLTSHNTELPSVSKARASVLEHPELMRKGPGFVAAKIADVLTQRYLPLMHRIEHEIDGLEKSITRDLGPRVLEVVFRLKDKLQRLRRVGAHQRDVLARMARSAGAHENEFIPVDVQPFFRDAYDDFVRVVDLNDSFRETVNSAADAYLAMQRHKRNQTMKVLTMISTIMLPLTFIAAIYGMNFDPDSSPYNMPELRWRYGYFFALATMAITAGLLLWMYWRKRWL